jgi:hypothetical protein
MEQDPESFSIRKISANPRDIGNLWRPRTQEMTGGFNGREMGNYGDLDVNPNENADGLSHHTRQTPEDGESLDQRDSKKRREQALRELLPGLVHVDVRESKIDDELGRSPMMEQENNLLESGLGVDLGANGLSMSAGANVGTVRSDTANVTYGHPSRGRIRASSDDDGMFTDVFDVLKARRKYKGRKYDEDEESEEDEKKSKKKKKRKKKRRGKKGKKAGGKHETTGGREPKSKTKRRARNVALQLDTGGKRQSFNPTSRSIPLRMRGSTRTEGIPLRLRDPVAWQRKLANEKMRREQGSLPRSMTHHRSAGGTGISQTGTRGGYVGGTKGSTKMPAVPQMGTSMRGGQVQDRIARGWVGDPLGVQDPLAKAEILLKARGLKLSRAEILHLKKKVEALMRKLEKLTKSPPIFDENSKRGNQASEERSSAPTGPTEVNVEDSAGYRFDDTSLALETGIVGKR